MATSKNSATRRETHRTTACKCLRRIHQGKNTLFCRTLKKESYSINLDFHKCLNLLLNIHSFLRNPIPQKHQSKPITLSTRLSYRHCAAGGYLQLSRHYRVANNPNYISALMNAPQAFTRRCAVCPHSLLGKFKESDSIK